MAAADSCPIHGKTFMAIHPKTGEPYCEDCRMAREGDFSYVRPGFGVKEKPRPETCRWSAGCNQEATCMPRLYVPASQFLSMNPNSDDVSALLTLPFCDRHFYQLDAQQILNGAYGGEEIKAAVSMEFRKRAANPNFAKAVIGRIPTTDPDYLRGQKANDAARKPQ